MNNPAWIGAAVLAASVLWLIHNDAMARAETKMSVRHETELDSMSDQMWSILDHRELLDNAAATHYADQAAAAATEIRGLRAVLARADTELAARGPGHPIVTRLAHEGPLGAADLVRQFGPKAVTAVSELLVTGELRSTWTETGPIISFVDPGARHQPALAMAGA